MLRHDRLLLLLLAGLDRSTGLCCPVGVRDTLAQSFQDADELLLKELKGEAEGWISGSAGCAAMSPRRHPLCDTRSSCLVCHCTSHGFTAVEMLQFHQSEAVTTN